MGGDHSPGRGGAEGRAPEPGTRVADVDAEEVVVFLIGMRVNRWRTVRSWWPVFTAMPRMLAELARHPEDGLLDAQTFWAGRTFLVVQHWRSAEHLGRYARAGQRSHAPAWARFNRSAARASGDVGIFHETFVVPREGVESRYANMPPTSLGAAYGTVAPARRRRLTAADRRVAGTAETAGPAA